VDYKEFLKRLKKEGWEIQAGGRHVKAKKGSQRVPIPAHGNKDIKLGTLKRIEKLTGVKLT
jgi:predicted RNA binding protein YcfA (HicA-like mRNA interferase family)